MLFYLYIILFDKILSGNGGTECEKKNVFFGVEKEVLSFPKEETENWSQKKNPINY